MTGETTSSPPDQGSRTAFVYILKCADNTLYTGWTFALKERLLKHQAGKGAKYTRSRLPVELVYFEELPGEGLARRREYALKQLSRKKKITLIASRELNLPE